MPESKNERDDDVVVGGESDREATDEFATSKGDKDEAARAVESSRESATNEGGAVESTSADDDAKNKNNNKKEEDAKKTTIGAKKNKNNKKKDAKKDVDGAAPKSDGRKKEETKNKGATVKTKATKAAAVGDGTPSSSESGVVVASSAATEKKEDTVGGNDDAAETSSFSRDAAAITNAAAKAEKAKEEDTAGEGAEGESSSSSSSPRPVVVASAPTPTPIPIPTANVDADVRRRRPTSEVPEHTTVPPKRPTVAPVVAAVRPASSSALDDETADDDDSGDMLLSMSFNQDGGCLAVGTGAGFRICNAHPFQETFRRTLGDDDDGDGAGGGGAGIAHIEMLYRTNLLALTGHSSSPRYPPNKVLIYDDHLQRTIGELSFRQKVLATKLRRDRIVVVLRDRVYVYNFSDLALLDKVHTGDNPLGLVGISTDNGGVGGSTVDDVLGGGATADRSRRSNGMVLACPGARRGRVRVELYGLRRTTAVDAHESALGALALTADGSLLATASERGTVIRLFDTRGVAIGGGGGGSDGVGATSGTTASVSSSVPLREFRRGVERATIACLTFSLDSNWLGCASDHGTVHVFRTHDRDDGPEDAAATATKKKRSSMTGRAMRMLPKLVSAPRKYLMDGTGSCARIRGVPHPRACAFVPDRERTIAVAGTDEHGNGCLLLAEFGARGPGAGEDGTVGEGVGGARPDSAGSSSSSEARRLGYHRFFKRRSPSVQSGRGRTKSKGECAEGADAEGGAYIDDAPVDMRMNHIAIGDENEDDFVPIDYNNAEK